MRYPLSLLVLVFPLLLLSCSAPASSTGTDQPMRNSGSTVVDSSIDSLFSAAIMEAKNPEPRKIYRNLTRIHGNPNLIDTIIEGRPYILVASWQGNLSYYPDKGPYNTGNYDIWITVAPQVQERCRTYRQFYETQQEVEMRLRQLLGLQPNNRERAFLELWVHPQDLFRPCPDNETNDTECGLSLPNNVDSAYRYWFNNLRAIQYVDCTDTLFGQAGYPWTQLGYTYDWSADNPSHVGLSEFVIRRNVTVWVRGKVPTTEYCAQKW